MVEKPKILVVDDEAGMCRSLQILLSEDLDADVTVAGNYLEAVNQLDHAFDLAIVDLTMPGKDGIEVLKEIKKVNPSTQVLLMTAYSTVESAIRAMKEGAFDYLIKPFKSADLLKLIASALRSQCVVANQDGSASENRRTRFGELIGMSSAMQNVFDLVEKASVVDSPVLILGESGTGKEMAAQAIHYGGIRKRAPFRNVNCTALPIDELEEYVFGNGGANPVSEDGSGMLAEAEGGTLFFDEVGDLSDGAQERLLRFLQARETVGKKSGDDHDVRCIASTKVELLNLIAEKKFREDLYYRLNVFTIHMPPLRERKEDIPLLANHFLKNKCQKFRMSEKQFDEAAMQKLVEYEFPGNVRELANLIEQAVLVSKGEVIVGDEIAISEASRSSSKHKPDFPIEDGWTQVRNLSRRLEKELLERAMRTHSELSNSEIASLLGTSRRVLELRLKEFNINKS